MSMMFQKIILERAHRGQKELKKFDQKSSENLNLAILVEKVKTHFFRKNMFGRNQFRIVQNAF